MARAARQMKQVESAEVREWAQENDWRDELNRPVADRGRMPSGLIDAYNRANKRYFKEYQPQPRPVRADYRDQAEQEKAERERQREERNKEREAAAAKKTAGNGRSTAKATTSAAPKAEAAVPAPRAEAAPVMTEGVQSLRDVVEFLTAAENKKGTRQAVVTIQALVTV